MSSIRPELDALGVPVVDLLDTFAVNLNPAPFAAYPGDVHPNARGHALIFENLYKGLHAQPQAWAALAGQD
jgi:lysophospholipase L1-like esterase